MRWLRNGGDAYALSTHLGHTSIKTVEVYLGHLTARQQAVARFGAQSNGDVGKGTKGTAT